MTCSKDQADALLFAFTTNRQFVVRGRNVGKTAMMNATKTPPFKLHPAQARLLITLDELYEFNRPPHDINTCKDPECMC